METVNAAILESIQYDKIVYIEQMQGGEEFTKVANDLESVCENSTSYEGPENDCTYVYEYWGINQNNNQWRIHLIGPKTV